MPIDKSRQSIQKVAIVNSVYTLQKILALYHPLPLPINTPPSYTPLSPYTRFQHIKCVGLLIFSIPTQGKAMREN
jgi:hypothetical protein